MAAEDETDKTATTHPREKKKLGKINVHHVCVLLYLYADLCVAYHSEQQVSEPAP